LAAGAAVGGVAGADGAQAATNARPGVTARSLSRVRRDVEGMGSPQASRMGCAGNAAGGAKDTAPIWQCFEPKASRENGAWPERQRSGSHDADGELTVFGAYTTLLLKPVSRAIVGGEPACLTAQSWPRAAEDTGGRWRWSTAQAGLIAKCRPSDRQFVTPVTGRAPCPPLPCGREHPPSSTRPAVLVLASATTSLEHRRSAVVPRYCYFGRSLEALRRCGAPLGPKVTTATPLHILIVTVNGTPSVPGLSPGNVHRHALSLLQNRVSPQ
jgi:hypothetical protein